MLNTCGQGDEDVQYGDVHVPGRRKRFTENQGESLALQRGEDVKTKPQTLVSIGADAYGFSCPPGGAVNGIAALYSTNSLSALPIS